MQPHAQHYSSTVKTISESVLRVNEITNIKSAVQLGLLDLKEAHKLLHAIVWEIIDQGDNQL